MLVASMLLSAPDGRVLVSANAPDSWVGGCPTDRGMLSLFAGAPQVWAGGLAYHVSGGIAAGVPPTGGGFTCGLALGPDGRLIVDLDGPIAGYVSGLPVTADGALVGVVGGP